jgi:hypothetical protein
LSRGNARNLSLIISRGSRTARGFSVSGQEVHLSKPLFGDRFATGSPSDAKVDVCFCRERSLQHPIWCSGSSRSTPGGHLPPAHAHFVRCLAKRERSLVAMPLAPSICQCSRVSALALASVGWLPEFGACTASNGCLKSNYRGLRRFLPP